MIIDVDYHPCDPGNSKWYCERSGFPKDELKAGMRLAYEDPGGLFGSILVKEINEEGVVLEYCGKEKVLNSGKPYMKLDEGGRDYTEFELNVSLTEDDEPEPDDEYEEDDGRWDAYV